MKLNELVCPNCGLKCMTDCAYTTCAGCQTFFYASQSRTCNQPAPSPPYPYITQPIVIQPLPTPPGPPWNPWPVTCGTVVTYGTTDQSDYQLWN